jgi:hypothetical protein
MADIYEKGESHVLGNYTQKKSHKSGMLQPDLEPLVFILFIISIFVLA